MPPAPVQNPTALEAKLDEIILHLQRLDKRDKWRTVGGSIRTAITLIPLILLLGSAWYFVQHGAEFMKMVADQAAKSAATYTQTQSQSLYEKFLNQYSTPKAE